MDLTDLPGTRLLPATPADAAELLVLQRCCWVEEALLNNTLDIPALHESLDDIRADLTSWHVSLVRQGPRLIAAVRGRLTGDAWEIGRLMVAPDLAGRGLGRRLLAHVETAAPAEATRFELFTGAASKRNITLYERAGYTLTTQPGPANGHIAHAVFLVKPRSRGDAGA
ncbi:GNAT family N-acetyltransferase [Amycolatopsis rhabdoformis]|uniref:GNAT family N-acetyltransferase n=1 Tax=Amycolatopsis rhabdoformis TaxID=1448059 RepID=A0ABZ1HW31_9PSEU|nr:GNAT family N-acetyltransferase [Amycolatopsis rhabdoformis]WSE26457.1 GNAT family N-acetyltransferase [Amycolatopsis rhabdoformis]